MAHLAGFTLVQASEDQVLLSRQRQFTTWARGLSEAQFLEREIQLEKREHASDGKMIIWVLVPRDNPQSLDFRCSCETFRRQALIVKPSMSSPEKVTAYGIASVFCPPEYRRQGYGSHMMRLLHHVLAPPGSLPPFPKEWGTPPTPHSGAGDALFSVLYSDVGDFYERCGPSPSSVGWHIKSSVTTIWSLGHEVTSSVDDLVKEFELLSEEQCETIWEADAGYITKYISQFPSSSHTRFTFLPNHGVASFLVSRSELSLVGSNTLPEYWGVSVPQNDDSSPVYATWTLDTSPSEPPVLVVTRLRAKPESFPALMKALVIAAQAVGANTIEAWNLDTGLVGIATSLGGKTGPRNEHLPAVAWYGPEPPDEIEWVFNEKFPWC